MILLTIDTLPAFQVGCYGCPDARTRILDREARRGRQARDAIAPTPLTAPSHATILTGLEPPRHGVRDNGLFRLRDDVVCVAERLPQDVISAAFVGAAPLEQRINLGQGFGIYDDGMPAVEAAEPPRRRAADVLDRGAAWLESGGGPRFLWVHVFDAHYPYVAAPAWVEAARGNEYAASVAAQDREIGRFLRRVRSAGQSVSLVIVADHGESLDAHGEITHGLFVYDATQRVPLVVVEARVEAGSLDLTLRSIADVAPTLLELHGVGAAEFPGASLLGSASEHRHGVYVESRHPELFYGWSSLFGWRTPSWKYVEAPSPELYDLATDPAETRNVIARHPEVAADLARRVSAVRAEGREGAAEALPDAAARRLEALGYVGSPGDHADDARRKSARAMDPKDRVHAAAALFRGLDAIRREDWAAAETELQRALDLAPERSEALLPLARARLRRGKHAEAAASARGALERRPAEAVEARVVLGRALLAGGRPAEALPHLEAAFRQRPGDQELATEIREAKARMEIRR